MKKPNEFGENSGIKPWVAVPEKGAIEKEMRGKRVFEYGAGGSTIYFGAIAKEYYSIETHKDWYEAVKRRISLPHVKLFYEESEDKYLQKIKEVGGDFDVVFVDNSVVSRMTTALASFDYLKDDGVLILHDATDGWWGDIKEENKILLTKYDLIRTIASTAFFKKKSK